MRNDIQIHKLIVLKLNFIKSHKCQIEYSLINKDINFNSIRKLKSLNLTFIYYLKT